MVSRLMHIMEQVRTLKNGVGVQSLLDAAYQILDNPLVMFSTEHKLMAHTGIISDDPIGKDIVTQGMFSEKTRTLFYDEGFIEEIANSARVVLLKSKKLKHDRFLGKLFNKNNAYVASVMMVDCNNPFEENDAMVFEAVCKLISKEISSIDFFQEYEQTHQETIIKSLIDGSLDKKLDVAQVGILYDSLASNLYIATVDISLCDSGYDAVHFRDLLKQIEPKYKYAIYSHHIVAIISTNNDVLNVSEELRELISFFERHNMYVGISNRFENLFELQKYYAEAQKMMQFVWERNSSQRIFPFHKSSLYAMEQINALENGLGIQYFLDIGPKIFVNPLLFHDMELNLLACSQDVEINDPIWEELITYGTSSDETINLFKTEGFIGIMENTKGGAVLISEKIKYDRISWRIYNNDNIMIGCLSIVNTLKQFTEDTLVLFGAFSQKFSKEVGKLDFYNNYGQLYSDTVINRLISGKIDDHTFYSEDIGNLYANLMDNLYLVAIDTSQCNSEQVNLTYIRDLFNRLGTANRYAVYANYIIVIISTDRTTLHEHDAFHEIAKAFEQNNIYGGISGCFSNIYELQKYYAEAVAALTSGCKHKQEHGGPWIFRYEDAQAGDCR